MDSGENSFDKDTKIVIRIRSYPYNYFCMSRMISPSNLPTHPLQETLSQRMRTMIGETASKAGAILFLTTVLLGQQASTDTKKNPEERIL